VFKFMSLIALCALAAPTSLDRRSEPMNSATRQSPPTQTQEQRVQRAIPGVIRADTKVELIKGGFQGLEGPVATPEGGLFFSDVQANRTYELGPDGTVAVWRENTNGTNGLFLLSDGRLLAAEGGGRRVVVVARDKRVTALAAAFNGQSLRAPNDLIPDRQGGIYFTDPAIRPAPNLAPKEPGNVYYLGPNGQLRLLDDAIRRPNGITLSLDGNTLFVDDTEGLFVYAFDAQPDGSVTNKREFVKLMEPEVGSLGPRSRADGMAIDSVGRLYVATSAGVQVIDSRGQHLGIIRLPAIARNLAFGRPDRHVLYLTALEALYRVRLISQGPPERAK
jgi:gluconolactonase